MALQDPIHFRFRIAPRFSGLRSASLRCLLSLCPAKHQLGGRGSRKLWSPRCRTERLAATLTLHSDASSWLIYDLAVTSPDQIPITVSVGLGQLGSVGIPISFNVPHQALLSGKAPSVFSQSGVLEDPISHSSKKYTFAIAPTAGTVQPDGYAATGKLTVQWQ